MQSITMLAAHAGWYPDELAEGLEVERYRSQTARRDGAWRASFRVAPLVKAISLGADPRENNP